MNSIKLSARAFYNALNIAGVERKTPIPVLTCVLVQSFGPVIRIIGTDLDKTTLTELPAETTGVVPPFLVPCRKALDLLKSEDGELTITPLENHWLKLSVPGCDYDLVSMDVNNFPQTPDLPAAQFSIEGEAFKTLLAHTSFAIAAQESRYTLNGALFEVNHETLKIVATDGHRLAMDQVDVPGAPNGKAVIPRPVLEWMKTKLNKTNVRVALGNGATPGEDLSCFTIDALHTTLVFRNLSGQFPNYEAIMPRRDSIKTTIAIADATGLYKSLVKVAQCADERSGAVRFSANGCFQIDAESTETGKASATVPAIIEGDEITIGLSSPYVLDFLKAAGANPITLCLRDKDTAGLFESPELPGFAYVLMPMRM
jgi:DNA polymerase III subunit beta